MLRLVCTEVDGNDAAHVGGPVHTRYRTFDVELPELEEWLRSRGPNEFTSRSVTGVEMLPIQISIDGAKK
jgi:hypothetical protein